MKLKLAIIGFGNVGQGLCEILTSKREWFKTGQNFEWELVAVSDFQKGSVLCDDGLRTEELLKLVQSSKSLEDYSGKCTKGLDAITTIQRSNADVVVEVTYTNIKTAEPATAHVKTAFSKGKNVVSSNKGPAALHYAELKKLAEANGVQYLIEGTVMSGTPVLSFAKENLAGVQINSIRGIFNGTSNFILTEMWKGKSYKASLSEAQELGYAEAVPDADVEGYDALAKVTILANVLMGTNLNPSQIKCEGITGITEGDILKAKAENKKWKLIGEIIKEGTEVKAEVGPRLLNADSAMGGIDGVLNAVTFTTDLLDDVTVVGPGAGRKETGFAILSDLLRINRALK